jgi:tripartite-type tricarboxylate transporter receptor subunit TctC
MKRSLIIGGLLLGLTITMWAAGNPCAAQEKFPTKPIYLLVGFNPGGVADLPKRALGEAASKILGQPVVVLNKPGAGGAVALNEVKNAEPDGYTIGDIAVGAITSPHMRKATYHPVDDFDAILQIHTTVHGIVVKTDSPLKSFKDLVAYAQANPNKVKYSTSGASTPQHLVMMELADLLNIKWTHVPFASGNEAIAALLGGHVDCSAQSSEWKPHVVAGRLRLLATCGEKRMESFPDVPTLIELGYNVKSLTTCALVAPKGTPKDRIKILHDAFHKSTEYPPFIEVLKKFDLPPAYKNSQDTQVIIKEIYEKSGKLIEKIQKP